MSTSTSTKSEIVAYAAELVDRLDEFGLEVEIYKIIAHTGGTVTIYLTYGGQTLPYLVAGSPPSRLTRVAIHNLILSLTLNMITCVGDDGSPWVDRQEVANRDAMEAIDATIGRDDPFEPSNPGGSGP